MDRHGDGHSQQDKGDRKDIHLKSAFLEGVEESRADLKAYREHEQDQAEVLHKVHHGRVHPEAEMTQQDSHEQNPRGTDGDAFDLEFAKVQSDRDHDCEN